MRAHASREASARSNGARTATRATRGRDLERDAGDHRRRENLAVASNQKEAKVSGRERHRRENHRHPWRQPRRFEAQRAHKRALRASTVRRLGGRHPAVLAIQRAEDVATDLPAYMREDYRW
jgi:hypothetical protein